MPIILEAIEQVSGQDQQDLLKIYQDYPYPLTDDLNDWLQQQTDSKQVLWAGRFNDRLLVAATVNDDGQHWQLDHLCVRKLTRRRGTASQFLTLLSRQAQQANRVLSINSASNPEALEPLLEHNGFAQQADFSWQK